MIRQDTTYDQHPPDRDYGPTILIVDDEEIGRQRLRLACSSIAGSTARLLIVEGVQAALSVLASTPVHVVLLDKRLGERDGVEAIPEMLRDQPHLQILIVTGSGSVSDSVRALELGALGYVTKESPDSLLVAQIERAVRFSKLALEHACIQRMRRDEMAHELVINSQEMRKLASRARIAAESNHPVLLSGGTSETARAVASLVHVERKKYLKQQNRLFLSIDFSRESAEELEQKLFGSESTDSAGRVVVEQGFIELANHGTLFIENVNLASQALQLKLQRLLEDGAFTRLRGRRKLYTSFKLVCSARVDLEEKVARGEFREDLSLRISAFQIRLPKTEQQPSEERNLGIEELLGLPLNVVGPNFPGLTALLDALTERILLEAKSKCRRNKDIAKALKLSEGAVSQRLKKLEAHERRQWKIDLNRIQKRKDEQHAIDN